MKQCQEGNLVMGVANFNQEKAGGKTEKWLQQGALNSAFSSFPLLIFPLQGKKESPFQKTNTQNKDKKKKKKVYFYQNSDFHAA